MALWPTFLVASEWADSLELGALQIHHDYLQITTPSPIVSPDESSSNCTGTRKITVLRSLPSYSDSLAILIAAKLSSSPVRFYITSCHGVNMSAAYLILE